MSWHQPESTRGTILVMLGAVAVVPVAFLAVTYFGALLQWFPLLVPVVWLAVWVLDAPERKRRDEIRHRRAAEVMRQIERKRQARG